MAKVTKSVYRIPPPEERYKLLVANRLKNKQPVTDNEFRLIVSQILAVHRTQLVGVVGYLTMLANDNFGKLTDEQKKLIDDIISSSQKQIEEVNGLNELQKLR